MSTASFLKSPIFTTQKGYITVAEAMADVKLRVDGDVVKEYEYLANNFFGLSPDRRHALATFTIAIDDREVLEYKNEENIASGKTISPAHFRAIITNLPRKSFDYEYYLPQMDPTTPVHVTFRFSWIDFKDKPQSTGAGGIDSSGGITIDLESLNLAASIKDVPDTVMCSYCRENKQYLATIYPGEYDVCVNSGTRCCQAKCPIGTKYNEKIGVVRQCCAADMGPAGDDCWHDQVPNPERPSGSSVGESYCKSACAVAAMRMALSNFEKDSVSLSEQLFCGSNDQRVYTIDGSGRGGGSSSRIKNVANSFGIADSKVSSVISHADIVSSFADGRSVIVLIREEGKTFPLERYSSKRTPGHFMIVTGVSTEGYILVHDPGVGCRVQGIRTVLSPNYIGTAVSEYVVV